VFNESPWMLINGTHLPVISGSLCNSLHLSCERKFISTICGVQVDHVSWIAKQAGSCCILVKMIYLGVQLNQCRKGSKDAHKQLSIKVVLLHAIKRLKSSRTSYRRPPAWFHSSPVPVCSCACPPSDQQAPSNKEGQLAKSLLLEHSKKSRLVRGIEEQKFSRLVVIVSSCFGSKASSFIAHCNKANWSCTASNEHNQESSPVSAGILDVYGPDIAVNLFNSTNVKRAVYQRYTESVVKII